ncbi:MAG: hypothetical protein GY913_16870 [Proteobacteria bacterium]|nr:hypothetical protein [Pseudomonadota bacterium]MCP4918577.1 hypothetical protein [Pseudomonadota bacterium]
MIGWEEAAGSLLLAGFLGGATLRHEDHQTRVDDRVAIWLDVAERAEARWAGEAEDGEPLLDGYPDRAEWDACVDQLRTPGCEGVRRAAVFFPGRDADIDAFWFEGPSGRDAWAFEQPVTSRDGARVRAGAVASLLGSPRYDLEPAAWSERALAGQMDLREAWAPEIEPLPFIETTAEFPPDSVPAFAERMVRSGVDEPASELALVAARIRRGDPISADLADQPGVAGLAALELARAGRDEALPLVERVAVYGPTSSDRLAGLYALERLQSRAR